MPGLSLSSDVPPTLVTQGCADGSLTLTLVEPSASMQSKAPESPDEANMLWPCSAICSKIMFSAWAIGRAEHRLSHSPQLELTDDARSSCAMRVYSSSTVCPVSSLGALYTMMRLTSGATESCVSMSASTSMSPE